MPLEKIYLAHHGILGQKWGVRRYQNKDGSLTSEGKNRYGSKTKSSNRTFTDADYETIAKKVHGEVIYRDKKVIESNRKMHDELSELENKRNNVSSPEIDSLIKEAVSYEQRCLYESNPNKRKALLEKSDEIWDQVRSKRAQLEKETFSKEKYESDKQSIIDKYRDEIDSTIGKSLGLSLSECRQIEKAFDVETMFDLGELYEDYSYGKSHYDIESGKFANHYKK